MSTPLTRLLGFAPLVGIDALLAALAAVSGPEIVARRGPDVAALLQTEPPAPLLRRGAKALLAGLHTVQRRLETACQFGPFLPMDPAAACLPAGTAATVLEPAWSEIAAALAEHGATQQWDIALRWPPQAVVARDRAEIAAAAAGRGPAGLAEAVAAALRAERARREAALLAVLKPCVMAVAPGGALGGEAEVVVTVQLPRNGEAAVEAALSALEPEADAADTLSIDMRGPLPPLSFAAARLASVAADEVVRAWRRLDLPERIDRAALHRQWRRRAAAVHPDRLPAEQAEAAAAALGEVSDAYHLLRSLLPAEDGDVVTVTTLLRRAGPRLVLPPVPAATVSEAAALEAYA